MEQLTQNSTRCLHSVDTLQNGARVTWRRRIVEWSRYFVFFVHKKYSRSFIKLRLNPWCHMDYFTDLLATFLDVDRVITLLSMESQRALRMHQTYLKLCSEDERSGFGTTWGWVINDKNFHFGWTIPLRWRWHGEKNVFMPRCSSAQKLITVLT